MTNIDIPQLSSDGIQFDNGSFKYVYSVQSSSTLSPISSVFDATDLEQYISFGDRKPSSTSHVVKKLVELDSIPSNVEDLWIKRFDTAGLTDYSFNRFQSLKTLVIGNGIFWNVTSFELSNLQSLQSIDTGNGCFNYAPAFSLTGLID